MNKTQSYKERFLYKVRENFENDTNLADFCLLIISSDIRKLEKEGLVMVEETILTEKEIQNIWDSIVPNKVPNEIKVVVYGRGGIAELYYGLESKTEANNWVSQAELAAGVRDAFNTELDVKAEGVLTIQAENNWLIYIIPGVTTEKGPFVILIYGPGIQATTLNNRFTSSIDTKVYKKLQKKSSE